MSDEDDLRRELERLRGRGHVVQDSVRTGLTVRREGGTVLVVLRPGGHRVEVLEPGVSPAWIPTRQVARAVEERLARAAARADPD